MSNDRLTVSATMECDEFTRTLDAYLDRELAPREEAESAEHLANCQSCRLLAESAGHTRAALRAGLRTAMGSDSEAGRAPEALRERILLAVAHERKPLLRRLVSPVPLGAMAACAAGVLVVLATQGGTDPLIEESVRKHTRDLPLEVTTASLGPESIAGWLAGKLDFNPAPPQFQGRDVRLVGARLSHIQDHPAAYMRYDLPRGHLGLFILDDPDRRYQETSHLLLHSNPEAVRILHARGFNVAVWRRNEIVYSLVSDLDEGDLVRLVEAAQAHPASP